MSQYKFKMPDIGEGVVEAEITAWHIKVGDVVKEDAPVADAMTDKATVELTAPVSGTVVSVGCAEGEIMAIGGDLVVFQTSGDVAAPQTISEAKPEPEKQDTKKPIPITDAPKPTPKRVQAPVTLPVKRTGGKPLASPAVRKSALDQDIDLAQVTATGKAGQITHEDLQNFITNGPKQSSNIYTKNTGTTEIKVVGMRRIISERMSASKKHIPHFSYVEAVDMTALEDLRTHLNKTRKDTQPKLTLIPFFMRAMVKGLGLWPQCNATFDDEAGIITQHNGVHIGMAAQTRNGLMVPVIKHVESLDIWQIAAEVLRLGEAAKTGTIAASDLSGGTITLTSLGPLGGIVTTPVINRPEVGILGPNKIVETPVIKSGQITVRKMMNISSSFDHRVVDGLHAAELIGYIKNLLENPATLFMD
ncbi:MAG: 2-oxo acid dehydrogenase subunit E2 [Robiginitomaculum sp.]|nr:2-oxo acid dehydrogenase subunit E2 [Robiginitomaculum sp.]